MQIATDNKGDNDPYAGKYGHDKFFGLVEHVVASLAKNTAGMVNIPQLLYFVMFY